MSPIGYGVICITSCGPLSLLHQSSFEFYFTFNSQILGIWQKLYNLKQENQIVFLVVSLTLSISPTLSPSFFLYFSLPLGIKRLSLWQFLVFYWKLIEFSCGSSEACQFSEIRFVAYRTAVAGTCNHIKRSSMSFVFLLTVPCMKHVITIIPEIEAGLPLLLLLMLRSFLYGTGETFWTNIWALTALLLMMEWIFVAIKFYLAGSEAHSFLKYNHPLFLFPQKNLLFY